MKKCLTLIFILILVFSFQVSAQKSVFNDSPIFLEENTDYGLLFKDSEIKFNGFKVMPIIEDIGFVNDPEYYFAEQNDFPLNHRFFITKIEDSRDLKKYIPVKIYKSSVIKDNRYWIYRAKTSLYGKKVELNYQFTKKVYSKEKNINYLELLVTIKSNQEINAQLELSNYFLAKSYQKGKGYLHQLSNQSKENLYNNTLIKEKKGSLQKVYNVRTFAGDDKYQSIRYQMEISKIRAGLTNILGRLDFFYNKTEATEESLKYYENIFY